MRECGSTLHVASGKDAGADVSSFSFTAMYPRASTAMPAAARFSAWGIGLAARGDEQIGAFDRAVHALSRYRQADAGAGARNGCGRCIEENLNAVFAQQLRYLLSDVRVLL